MNCKETRVAMSTFSSTGGWVKRSEAQRERALLNLSAGSAEQLASKMDAANATASGTMDVRGGVSVVGDLEVRGDLRLAGGVRVPLVREGSASSLALSRKTRPVLTLGEAESAVRSWTVRQASGPSAAWRRITWAAGLGEFVSVGQSRILRSADGISWASSASEIAADSGFWGVAWAPSRGLLVAVGEGAANVASSSDAATWTAVASSQPTLLRSVAWAPELDRFVAVGGSENGGPEDMLALTIDVPETPGPLQLQYRKTEPSLWTGVCWAPELRLFVAVSRSGGDRQAMTSPDGEIWTLQTTPTSGQTWNSVEWAAPLGLLVAVSRQGKVMTSRDGVTWTLHDVADEPQLVSVVWVDTFGLLVAIAARTLTENGTSIWTSRDGMTWKKQWSTVAANTGYGLAWSPELGMLAGTFTTGNRALTSTLAWRVPTAANVFASPANSIDETGTWRIMQVLKPGSYAGTGNPNVRGVHFLKVGNAGNITTLTNGIEGQVVTLQFTGTAAGTTLVHDASAMRLAGGVNFQPQASDTIRLLRTGTVWIEVGRSLNR
jgi:hypothetical protein